VILVRLDTSTTLVKNVSVILKGQVPQNVVPMDNVLAILVTLVKNVMFVLIHSFHKKEENVQHVNVMLMDLMAKIVIQLENVLARKM